jgi:hypothetical protein
MLCCASRSQDGRPHSVDETRFLRAVTRRIEGAILHFSRAVGILLTHRFSFPRSRVLGSCDSAFVQVGIPDKWFTILFRIGNDQSKCLPIGLSGRITRNHRLESEHAGGIHFGMSL